jgi:hypothetical protein
MEGECCSRLHYFGKTILNIHDRESTRSLKESSVSHVENFSTLGFLGKNPG